MSYIPAKAMHHAKKTVSTDGDTSLNSAGGRSPWIIGAAAAALSFAAFRVFRAVTA